MNTETNKLLDRAAKRLITPSDYRLSKALGVSANAVSKWRLGRNHMADTAAMKLAEILGEPTDAVLALIASDRTDDPVAKKLWTNMARKLKASAAVVSLATLGLTAFPSSEAHAADLSSSHGMYIMLSNEYNPKNESCLRAKVAEIVEATPPTMASVECNDDWPVHWTTN